MNSADNILFNSIMLVIIQILCTGFTSPLMILKKQLLNLFQAKGDRWDFLFGFLLYIAMDFKLLERGNIEKTIGVGCLALAIVLGIRQGPRLNKLYRNYDHYMQINPQQSEVMRLKKEPEIAERVLLANLQVTPTQTLFPKHLGYVGDVAKESSMNFSYREDCPSFTAELPVGKEHIPVFCDCEDTTVYASSSLMCNLKELLKPGNKQKLTMLGYGSLRYCSNTHRFILKSESFATSLDEIDRAWSHILGLKSPYFFLVGALTGIGLSLLTHKDDSQASDNTNPAST